MVRTRISLYVAVGSKESFDYGWLGGFAYLIIAIEKMP